MNLFFSPPVKTYNLLSSHHSACRIVEELIATSYAEFELEPYDDSTDPFYMIYSRLKSLKHKILKMMDSIQSKYSETLPELSQSEKTKIIGEMKEYMQNMRIDHLKFLDLMEHEVEEKFSHFGEISKGYDSLVAQVDRNTEELDTISAKQDLLMKNGGSNNAKEYVSEEFLVVTGACATKDRPMLERLMFRKTQGHCYSVFVSREQDDLDGLSNGQSSQRVIFLYFISKGVYRHIGDRLRKIFLLNKVELYELPDQEKHLHQYKQKLKDENIQLLNLLKMSGEQLTTTLRDKFVGSGNNLRHDWVRASYLERILYIVCHSRKVGGHVSVANYIMFTVHMPASEQLPSGLDCASIVGSGGQSSGSQTMNNQSGQSKNKHRTILPRLPCLEEVNMLTELYSIPRYNEIVPSVFMFTTVPVLFGMMFSDFGHGLILLALCVYLKAKPLFFMMAFMSIYCGVIYNEFFGMKILRTEDMGILHGKWGVAENGLNFENSLKMKISMVMAFVHMFFGMCLKVVNELKRKQIKLIVYDSLPKIGLLCVSVGYLVLLIVTKWLTDFNDSSVDENGISNGISTAPSIINCMLELYLGWNPSRKHSIFSSIEREKHIGSWALRLSCLFILIMVYNHTIREKCEYYLPMLLLLKRDRKGRYSRLGQKSEFTEENEDEYYDDLELELDDVRQISEELEKEGHKISENSSKIMAKNKASRGKSGNEAGIDSVLAQYEEEEGYYQESEDSSHSELGPLEVFEFVLSLISSTTSYLRLFALSLAHAKLSHLLLTFLLGGLAEEEPSLSMIKCFVFFQATLGLMILLDVMECIMHVVRLHWVEWMGKFYVGGGKIFMPEKWEDY